MSASPDIDNFKERIDDYISNSLTYNSNIFNNKGKFIHDSVWGTTFYYPWEIALLDSPILQRLRNIHQTGLAFLVYPTATHTRFDHTLGVVAIVDKLIDNLNKKKLFHSSSALISEEERINLRLAALLHDIGHGPFSHVSEDVYGKMEEFTNLKKWINEEYQVTPKPHEILSHMLVSSNNFISWFDSNIRNRNESELKLVNLPKIAEYIIGCSKEPEKKYLSDIINGPMDADKLDYLARDAKFSGLTIGYDVNRYFKTIGIHRRKFEDTTFVRLGVPLSGVNSLEQMIISKMMLFSSIYHHQKVRCAESMFGLLCKHVTDGKIKKNSNIKFEHPLDFLKYVDSDLINFSTSIDSNFLKKPVDKLHQCLCKRNLMKRSLIISRIFIQNIDENQTKLGYTKLIADFRKNNSDLKEKIIIKTKSIMRNEGNRSRKILSDDIIIDLPKQPSMEESLSTMVPIDSGNNTSQDIEIGEIIPIKQWAEGYNAVKFRGHIFCSSDIQEQVNKAARLIFVNPPYNIIFKKPATDHCHIKYVLLDEEKQSKFNT